MWSLEILNSKVRKWNMQGKARKNKENVCYKESPQWDRLQFCPDGLLWEPAYHGKLRIIPPKEWGSWVFDTNVPITGQGLLLGTFLVLLQAEWALTAREESQTLKVGNEPCRHCHSKTQGHVGVAWTALISSASNMHSVRNDVSFLNTNLCCDDEWLPHPRGRRHKVYSQHSFQQHQQPCHHHHHHLLSTWWSKSANNKPTVKYCGRYLHQWPTPNKQKQQAYNTFRNSSIIMQLWLFYDSCCWI